MRSFREMLIVLEIKLEGRHHSGIDDTRNTAKCALKLLLVNSKVYSELDLRKREPGKL